MPFLRRYRVALFVSAVAAAVLIHIQRAPAAGTATAAATGPAENISSPLAVVLTPLPGKGNVDVEIATLQAKIKETPEQTSLLERLGWSFVTKARLTNDPGFYKLAEKCSDAIEAAAPGNPDALLLRGHIFHALHRFKEAENIARQLVKQREFVFGYALLGDALMEQGNLADAVDAYQKMVDLKPCLQTYSRVAHMRWLKGDLPGAIAAARIAVSSGSAREPEPLAWAATRLGFYLLEQNDLVAARAATEEAAHYAPNYPPALLLRGRISLAESNPHEAIANLRQAAELSPLPEYLWTYAEALRADGQQAAAEPVEKKLNATGKGSDPRTYSLFLATQNSDPAVALHLATEELKDRQDVFTHDAAAWALFENKRIAEAQAESALALAEGTKDARLFFHAGAIAAAAGKPLDALTLLNRAHEQAQVLYPSEQRQLAAQIAALPQGKPEISSR